MPVVPARSRSAYATLSRWWSLGTLAAALVLLHAPLVAVVSIVTFHDESQTRPPSNAATGSIVPGWFLDGTWTGVAAEENSSTFYAISRGGHCVELEASGKVVREITFRQESGSILRLARAAALSRPALLVFSLWGKSLHAYAADGTPLWDYSGVDGNDGINDVWPATVRGAKADQVIIGYNGSTGLHVLNDQGRLVWKTTEIIGMIDDQGTSPEVGWAAAATPAPLLVVATGTQLKTFRVTTGEP